MLLQDTAVVTGMSKLGQALDKLTADMQEKVARKAILASAKIGLQGVQSEAASHPQIRTGNLYRNIRVARRNRDIPVGVVQYIIFVKTGGKAQRAGTAKRGFRGESKPGTPSGMVYPYYWFFIEFGTSRMAAQPFMLRGFLKTAESAANGARDAGTAALPDVVR